MLHFSFWIYFKFLSYEVMLSSGAVVKDSPANAGDVVWSLGWADPLEKEMAAHSSVLTWEIPWTEEPGGLQFTEGAGEWGESQRVGHDWERIWLTVNNWISDPGVYDDKKDLRRPGFSMYCLFVLDISMQQHCVWGVTYENFNYRWLSRKLLSIVSEYLSISSKMHLKF